MNLKQALKQKNILVEKIKQEFARANTYNSVETGNKRAYDPNVSLSNYLQLVEDLVDLKNKIHKANQPIHEKIFRLSEYKSIVKQLRTLNCSEGKVAANKWIESDVRFLESEIKIVDRDLLVEEYEDKINNIQDELDHFNQITTI
jgi:hypothetical protein